MQILFLSSEVSPFARTGGLADAARALPRALERLGHQVTVVMPFYRVVDAQAHGLAKRLRKIEVPLGPAAVPVGFYEGRLGESRVRLLFVDHPESFDRPGLYGEGGEDYPDNAERFALLSLAALELARAIGLKPDIVHANDWQTALAVYYLKQRYRDDGLLGRARAVFTIHNVAFQGLFDRRIVDAVGIDWSDFNIDGLEYWGKVSYLKAGIVYADALTTVSPRYARDIQTEEHGFGMEGVLRRRERDLVGILNGADYVSWSPGSDRHLAANYTVDRLERRRACKEALQRRLGLPVRPRTPLLAAVTRLTWQHGTDLLLDVLPELLGVGGGSPRLEHDEAGVPPAPPLHDVQVAVLGSSDPAMEARLRELQASSRERLAVVLGPGADDESLVHQTLAGSDFLVCPSRHEPNGVHPLHALRYGCLPVVRAIGGLDDTVVDIDPVTGTGTGFKFGPPTPSALLTALRRALACYADPALMTRLQKRAMAEEYSWAHTAKRYDAVYRRARSA